jgi:hypothetical protein
MADVSRAAGAMPVARGRPAIGIATVRLFDLPRRSTCVGRILIQRLHNSALAVRHVALRYLKPEQDQELSVRPSALPKHGHPWPFPRAARPTRDSLRGGFGARRAGSLSLRRLSHCRILIRRLHTSALALHCVDPCWSKSQEQELSVRPSAGPTYFSLRAQREVSKRKGTPRPRPPRIPALRVRVRRSGISDRPSLACRNPWPHPCGQPCGLIDHLTPLPRGPG